MQEPNPQKNRTIGHYVLGKTLGEGTFGKVKIGIHTLTNEKVAIKILEKLRIVDTADVERVSREIHILKLVRHPNVIQLYEIIETQKHIFLVMEFCEGGELFNFIVKNQKLTELQACKFFQELISGVEYLHKLHIVHRDLKPENLLFDLQQNLKLVDFGLSNTYKKQEMLKTACGSPCYAAPEMIAGNRYTPVKVDIWSCGVILFAALCGYLPFEDQNTSNLYKKILNNEYQLPTFLSPSAQDMVKKILVTDPEVRFDVDQIRSHPWFSIFKRTNTFSPGIIVGFNRMPIDFEILKSLSSIGYDPDYAEKCIDANKHNHITTAYYLLLKSHLKNGGQSKADINSACFDVSLLESKPKQLKTSNNIQIMSKALFKDQENSQSKALSQDKAIQPKNNPRQIKIPDTGSSNSQSNLPELMLDRENHRIQGTSKSNNQKGFENLLSNFQSQGNPTQERKQSRNNGGKEMTVHVYNRFSPHQKAVAAANTKPFLEIPRVQMNRKQAALSVHGNIPHSREMSNVLHGMDLDSRTKKREQSYHF